MPALYSDKYLAYHAALGKSVGEIIKMLDIPKGSRGKYRKRIDEIKNGTRQTRPSRKRNDMDEQLCWTCKARGCQWMLRQKPVEGWTAVKTSTCGGSYRISECPDYIKGVRR